MRLVCFGGPSMCMGMCMRVCFGRPLYGSLYVSVSGCLKCIRICGWKYVFGMSAYIWVCTYFMMCILGCLCIYLCVHGYVCFGVSLHVSGCMHFSVSGMYLGVCFWSVWVYLGVFMYICLFQNISACIWVCTCICVGVSLHVYRCVVHHRVFVPVPFLHIYGGGREAQHLAAWCLVSRALGLRAGLEWPRLGQAFPASNEAEQKQAGIHPQWRPCPEQVQPEPARCCLGVG